jgi:hypothetical protein
MDDHLSVIGLEAVPDHLQASWSIVLYSIGSKLQRQVGLHLLFVEGELTAEPLPQGFFPRFSIGWGLPSCSNAEYHFGSRGVVICGLVGQGQSAAKERGQK